MFATFAADYDAVLRGIAALPNPLPGSRYKTGLAAVARLKAGYAAMIADHRATPRDDGLGRILKAMEASPDVLTDADLEAELHHFVLAGNIIYAEFAEIVRTLVDFPEVAARLRAEDPAVLTSPYLQAYVMEVKRSCPNVPIAFGKAASTFELDGFTIEAGWKVFLCPGENNLVPEVFEDPAKFDPDRFTSPRNEHTRHPHAYAPQGCGEMLEGHVCLGIDLSTWFMAIFTSVLVHGATWELAPAAERGLRFDKLPPEPRDGLRARFASRSR